MLGNEQLELKLTRFSSVHFHTKHDIFKSYFHEFIYYSVVFEMNK